MEKEYMHWLCRIPGIGNKTISALLEEYHNAIEVYRASEKSVERFLNRRQLQGFLKAREEVSPVALYEGLAAKGIRFVAFTEQEYPGRLKHIPDPPAGIFYRGRLPEEDKLSVAIIGARDCSEYGSYVATELGAFLGKRNVQVISGMARGIDGIGQKAALDAGGTTTAVLGSGVDVCYPAQNRTLYDRILEQGGILSSYAPGTEPKAEHFPPRNRIVSGLSDAVVVIEARSRSGTLITVDMALEQGKEVYVVPGRITDRLSDGCNSLLKQGAGVLLSPQCFLEELRERFGRGTTGTDSGSERPDGGIEPAEPVGLEEDLVPLYRVLDFTPRTADELRNRMGGGAEKNIAEIHIGLMRLCLMGLAFQEAPGFYTKKRR